MTWLLDTNILSELRNKSPNPSVIEWITHHLNETSYLSVITIGELKAGISRLPSSKRRTNLQAWLEKDILQTYQSRILPIDTETMLIWGELMAKLTGIGKPMPIVDSLIASTARQHNLTLVTRNVADFQAVDISVINPWD